MVVLSTEKWPTESVEKWPTTRRKRPMLAFVQNAEENLGWECAIAFDLIAGRHSGRPSHGDGVAGLRRKQLSRGILMQT